MYQTIACILCLLCVVIRSSRSTATLTQMLVATLLECRRRGTGLGLILLFDGHIPLSLPFPVHVLTTVARTPSAHSTPASSRSVPLPSSPLLPLTRSSRVACGRSLQRRRASLGSLGSFALAGAYVFEFEHPADGAAPGSSYAAVPPVDVAVHHGARGRCPRIVPARICAVRRAPDPVVQQSVTLAFRVSPAAPAPAALAPSELATMLL
jgi:hypothetical protein